MKRILSVAMAASILSAAIAADLHAGAAWQGTAQQPARPVPLPGPEGPPYLIGPGDVLEIRVRDETSLSGKVIVRPDGKITLNALNDVRAGGLTIPQLADSITALIAKFYSEIPPHVSVDVLEFKSKWVYISGQGIAKSSAYLLTGPLKIYQLIATAGGLTEFAKGKDILIFRTEGNVERKIPFNYETFKDGTNLHQNIELMPGDQVVVP